MNEFFNEYTITIVVCIVSLFIGGGVGVATMVMSTALKLADPIPEENEQSPTDQTTQPEIGDIIHQVKSSVGASVWIDVSKAEYDEAVTCVRRTIEIVQPPQEEESIAYELVTNVKLSDRSELRFVPLFAGSIPVMWALYTDGKRVRNLDVNEEELVNATIRATVSSIYSESE